MIIVCQDGSLVNADHIQLITDVIDDETTTLCAYLNGWDNTVTLGEFEPDVAERVMERICEKWQDKYNPRLLKMPGRRGI